MARKPSDESSSSLAKHSPTFLRTMSRLRTRLRELRMQHGLSYTELHERSGVNWRQLVALEKGEPSNPTMATLSRLADALGVQIYELLMPAKSGVRAKPGKKQAASAELVQLSKGRTKKPDGK